ncbi:MAG: NADH-quinone oxidoreductase subunit A [Candidatus Heimdallarchaeota archaeon]
MAEQLILEQYLSVFVLLILGVMTVMIFVVLNKLLAPKRNTKYNIEGLSAFVAYECGEIPIGEAHTRFNFQYYVFALVFVIFDVVSSFLLAWALIIGELKLEGMLTAFAFLAVLSIGFIYWWKRDALRWM